MPIPKPNKGESQNDYISRCMGNAVMRKEFPSQKQRSAVCYSTYRKSKKENVELNFSVPLPTIISEELKEGEKRDSVKVKGIAIKARDSRNGITYEVSEIDKSKHSLIGQNLKVNHNNDVRDNVGRIHSASLDNDNLVYEGEVYNTATHPDIIQMIERGLVQYVSIEAIAGSLEEDEGKLIARNLDFTGLAFVDTPGIPEASVALGEAFNKGDAMEKLKEEEQEAPEEEKEEEKPEEPQDEAKEAFTQALKELKEAISNDKELKEEIKELRKEISDMKKSGKGVVTQEAPAPKYNIVKEKNKHKPGTVDMYVDGFPY